jgi:AraC family transcriptional regulator
MLLKLKSGHFHGQTLRCRSVADVIFTETHYPAQADIGAHAHESAYLCLVRRGAYTEWYGNQTRTCGPATVAFHPAGEIHRERFHGQETQSFNLELTPAWQARLIGHAPALSRPMAFCGGDVAGLAFRLFEEIERSDAASGLVVEGLVLELLGRMLRHGSEPSRPSPPCWAERAREILRDRFSDNLSLGDVARAVGVHPVHLATVFRRCFGRTVGEYVRHLRVEFACRALVRSDGPLVGIALAAGFTDQSHFCREVKRATGMTPTQYRRSFSAP